MHADILTAVFFWRQLVFFMIPWGKLKPPHAARAAHCALHVSRLDPLQLCGAVDREVAAVQCTRAIGKDSGSDSDDRRWHRELEQPSYQYHRIHSQTTGIPTKMSSFGSPPLLRSGLAALAPAQYAAPTHLSSSETPGLDATSFPAPGESTQLGPHAPADDRARWRRRVACRVYKWESLTICM